MTEWADLPPLFAEDHVCVACGLAYDSVATEGAVRLVDGAVDEMADLVGRLPAGRLRHQRAAFEWSPLEYVCHVRDVLSTFTLRLHRGVVEDSPAIDPMYAVLRAERFRYNEASLDAVIEELGAHTRGFTDEVAVVPVEAWDRTVIRRTPRRDEVRSLRWVVRQAAHEAVHHRDDIARITAR